MRRTRRLAIVAAWIAVLGSIALPSLPARQHVPTSVEVVVASAHVGGIDDATLWRGTGAAAVRAKASSPAFHLTVVASRSCAAPACNWHDRTPSATPRRASVPLYDLHRVYRV